MILLILLVSIGISICDEQHEVPTFKRGPTEVLDETALTNPNSFDYDFSDDLNKPVDDQDLYDQFIDQLPMFHIYQRGKDQGITEVPIVTRKWDTWFTPSTLSNKEERFSFYSTTPMTPKKNDFTTSSTTTTEKTTTQRATTRLFRRPLIAKQPVPAFKPTSTTELPSFNRGPIWRAGGVIHDTTSTRRPTTPRSWTVMGFRVRTTTPSSITSTNVPVTTVAQSRNKWIAGPRNTPSINQDWRNPIRTLQKSLIKSIPPTHSDPINRALPKPVIIQNPHSSRYRGPTYNCRVLNPFEDGTASEEHDPSCKMLYPGLSMDGSCRCFYKVSGRDPHGCATGFIYACRSQNRHSIAV